MVFSSLSSKIGDMSRFNMTIDSKLLLYHPTNRPFDLSDVKPQWFAHDYWIGVYASLGLSDVCLREHKNDKPPRYVMVFALDLKKVCRTPGTSIEISDGVILIYLHGHKYLRFCNPKLDAPYGFCQLLDYSLFSDGYVEYIATFNNRIPREKTTKLWQKLSKDGIVVIGKEDRHETCNTTRKGSYFRCAY